MFFTKENFFQVEGRLVNEPFVNISEKGNVVTSVRLALKTPFVVDGEYQTSFVSFTAIDSENNRIASNLANFVTVGSPVYLEGYFDSYSNYNKENPEKIDYYNINRIIRFKSLENKEQSEERKKNLEKQ